MVRLMKRLEGKREKMTHKMDKNEHGAMNSIMPHEHGHRIEERTEKD